MDNKFSEIITQSHGFDPFEEGLVDSSYRSRIDVLPLEANSLHNWSNNFVLYISGVYFCRMKFYRLSGEIFLPQINYFRSGTRYGEKHTEYLQLCDGRSVMGHRIGAEYEELILAGDNFNDNTPQRLSQDIFIEFSGDAPPRDIFDRIELTDCRRDVIPRDDFVRISSYQYDFTKPYWIGEVFTQYTTREENFEHVIQFE